MNVRQASPGGNTHRPGAGYLAEISLRGHSLLNYEETDELFVLR